MSTPKTITRVAPGIELVVSMQEDKTNAYFAIHSQPGRYLVELVNRRYHKEVWETISLSSGERPLPLKPSQLRYLHANLVKEIYFRITTLDGNEQPVSVNLLLPKSVGKITSANELVSALANESIPKAVKLYLTSAPWPEEITNPLLVNPDHSLIPAIAKYGNIVADGVQKDEKNPEPEWCGNSDSYAFLRYCMAFGEAGNPLLTSPAKRILKGLLKKPLSRDFWVPIENFINYLTAIKDRDPVFARELLPAEDGEIIKLCEQKSSLIQCAGVLLNGACTEEEENRFKQFAELACSHHMYLANGRLIVGAAFAIRDKQWVLHLLLNNFTLKNINGQIAGLVALGDTSLPAICSLIERRERLELAFEVLAELPVQVSEKALSQVGDLLSNNPEVGTHLDALFRFLLRLPQQQIGHLGEHLLDLLLSFPNPKINTNGRIQEYSGEKKENLPKSLLEVLCRFDNSIIEPIREIFKGKGSRKGEKFEGMQGRVNAGWALHAFGKRAVSAIPDLSDALAKDELRSVAILALSEMKDDLLEPLLRHPGSASNAYFISDLLLGQSLGTNSEWYKLAILRLSEQSYPKDVSENPFYKLIGPQGDIHTALPVALDLFENGTPAEKGIARLIIRQSWTDNPVVEPVAIRLSHLSEQYKEASTLALSMRVRIVEILIDCLCGKCKEIESGFAINVLTELGPVALPQILSRFPQADTESEESMVIREENAKALMPVLKAMGPTGKELLKGALQGEFSFAVYRALRELDR